MDKYQLKPFIDAIDNDNPTPGGGAVAAYVAALGLALVRMSGHVSFKKRAFFALSKDQQIKILSHFESVKTSMQESLSLVEKDEEAFLNFMASYRQVKETGDWNNSSFINASEAIFRIPEQLSELLVRVLGPIEAMLPYISASIISDVLVGASLIVTAAESGLITMSLNIGETSPKALKDRVRITKEKVVEAKQLVTTWVQRYAFREGI